MFKIIFTCSVLFVTHATEVSNSSSIFSPSWMKTYSEECPYNGCNDVGIGRFKYNSAAGLGFNLNSMLHTWMYFLVMKEWDNFSIISNNQNFKNLICETESNGLVSQGWDCLFNVSHISRFNNIKEWRYHLDEIDALHSDIEYVETINPKEVWKGYHWKYTKYMDDYLQRMGTNYFSAISFLAKHVWDHMSPWTRNDVDSVINYDIFESDYVSLHIRRGDKLIKEANMIPTEFYLKRAVEYLKKESRIESVKGIWVASDDPDVISEVKDISHIYFPSIPKENIVCGSSRRILNGNIVRTHIYEINYSSFVYLLSDFERLSKATVFVGTFSSNVGRFVALLREGYGFSRDSSISTDIEDWFPGGNSNPPGINGGK